MALPQSATAEAATATESALDNEKLKQEAEVQAERAVRGRGRGSWHESFRNVKMLCTLEVTVSGRGRVGEQGEMQLSDLCTCVCVYVCAPKFALRRQFPAKFKTARVEDCIHRRENERATERERGRVRVRAAGWESTTQCRSTAKLSTH